MSFPTSFTTEGSRWKGTGGAVELPAAVVRQRDAVDAEVGQALGVGQRLHALHDDLALPTGRGIQARSS